MIRRLLLIPILCGLLFSSFAQRANAQARPTTSKPTESTKPAAGTKAAVPNGTTNNAAAKPSAKTTVEQQPVEQPDPELDRVLKEWYDASKSIEKLEGQHVRFVYDFQWSVLKKAEGQFYYESPDKGRIDLSPSKIKAGEKVTKVNPVNGQNVTFNVEADMPERWVCDGAKILEINDAAKEVQTYEIPKEARGTNIMDGPLPFLFGMPPEKAKQRYRMRLVQQKADRYVIQVIPLRQQDAANYKWAVVILERKTMLPEAVQMIDPAQTTETVYTFPRVEKNPRRKLFGFAGGLFGGEPDPFKPNLKNFKIVEAGKEEPQQRVAQQQQAKGKPAGPIEQSLVPSVIGLDHEQAKKVLEARGFVPKFYEGKSANTPQEKFHAYDQSPAPKTPLEQGQIVKVQLYVAPSIATTKGTDRPASKKPGVADVRGLHWKEAQAQLQDAGFEVKFKRGRTATKSSEVNLVQTQSPAPGERIAEGDVVELTIIIAPDSAKK